MLGYVHSNFQHNQELLDDWVGWRANYRQICPTLRCPGPGWSHNDDHHCDDCGRGWYEDLNDEAAWGWWWLWRRRIDRRQNCPLLRCPRPGWVSPSPPPGCHLLFLHPHTHSFALVAQYPIFIGWKRFCFGFILDCCKSLIHPPFPFSLHSLSYSFLWLCERNQRGCKPNRRQHNLSESFGSKEEWTWDVTSLQAEEVRRGQPRTF